MIFSLIGTSQLVQTQSCRLNAVARPIQSNLITCYMPKPVGASRRKCIDQQVLRMIVKEYFPFSVVEDRVHQTHRYVKHSGYTLPSRKTLTTSLLYVMYNEV